jgi:hypothetical protein
MPEPVWTPPDWDTLPEPVWTPPDWDNDPPWDGGPPWGQRGQFSIAFSNAFNKGNGPLSPQWTTGWGTPNFGPEPTWTPPDWSSLPQPPW